MPLGRKKTFDRWVNDIVSADQKKSKNTISNMQEVLDKEMGNLSSEDKDLYFETIETKCATLSSELTINSSIKQIILLNASVLRYAEFFQDNETRLNFFEYYLKVINDLTCTLRARVTTPYERKNLLNHHQVIFESCMTFIPLITKTIDSENNNDGDKIESLLKLHFELMDLLKSLNLLDENKSNAVLESLSHFLSLFSTTLFHENILDPLYKINLLNDDFKKIKTWFDFYQMLKSSASLLNFAATKKIDKKLTSACHEHISIWKSFFNSNKQFGMISKIVMPMLEDILSRKKIEDLVTQVKEMKLDESDKPLSKSQKRKRKRKAEMAVSTQIALPDNNEWVKLELTVAKLKNPNLTNIEFIKKIFVRVSEVLEQALFEDIPAKLLVRFYENLDDIKGAVNFYTNWIISHSGNEFDDETQVLLNSYEHFLLRFNDVPSKMTPDELFKSLEKYIEFQHRRGKNLGTHLQVLKTEHALYVSSQEFLFRKNLLDLFYSLDGSYESEEQINLEEVVSQEEYVLPPDSIHEDEVNDHLKRTIENMMNLMAQGPKSLDTLIEHCQYWICYFKKRSSPSLFENLMKAKFQVLKKQMEAAKVNVKILTEYYRAASMHDSYQRQSALEAMKEYESLVKPRTLRQYIDTMRNYLELSEDPKECVDLLVCNLVLIYELLIKNERKFIKTNFEDVLYIYKIYHQFLKMLLETCRSAEVKREIDWLALFTNINYFYEGYKIVSNFTLVSGAIYIGENPNDKEAILSFLSHVSENIEIYEYLADFYQILNDADYIACMQKDLHSMKLTYTKTEETCLKIDSMAYHSNLSKMHFAIERFNVLKESTNLNLSTAIFRLWEFSMQWKFGICCAPEAPKYEGPARSLSDINKIETKDDFTQYLNCLHSYFYKMSKIDNASIPSAFGCHLEIAQDDPFPILKCFVAQIIEKIEAQFNEKRKRKEFIEKVNALVERLVSLSSSDLESVSAQLSDLMSDPDCQSPHYHKLYEKIVEKHYLAYQKNNLASHLKRIFIITYAFSPVKHLISQYQLYQKDYAVYIKEIIKIVNSFDKHSKSKESYLLISKYLREIFGIMIANVQQLIGLAKMSRDASGTLLVDNQFFHFPQIMSDYFSLLKLRMLFSTEVPGFESIFLETFNLFLLSFKDCVALVNQDDTDVIDDPLFSDAFIELYLMKDIETWNSYRYAPLFNTSLPCLQSEELDNLYEAFDFSKHFVLMVQALKTYAMKNVYQKEDHDKVVGLIQNSLSFLSDSSSSLIRTECLSFLKELEKIFEEKLKERQKENQRNKGKIPNHSLQKKKTAHPQTAFFDVGSSTEPHLETILKPRQFQTSGYSSVAEKRRAKKERQKEREKEREKKVTATKSEVEHQAQNPYEVKEVPPPTFNPSIYSEGSFSISLVREAPPETPVPTKIPKLAEMAEPTERGVQPEVAEQSVEVVEQPIEVAEQPVEVAEQPVEVTAQSVTLSSHLEQSSVHKDTGDKIIKLPISQAAIDFFWQDAPLKMKELIEFAKAHDLEIYVVGGVLRDWLLGKTAFDIDFIMKKPKQPLEDMLKGVFKVPGLPNSYKFGSYIDIKLCDEIDLDKDVQKRDAVINSFYLNKTGLYGLQRAWDEIYSDKPLTMIGYPGEVFKNNPKAILRMLCLKYKLNRELSQDVYDGMIQNLGAPSKLNYFEIRPLIFKLLITEKRDKAYKDLFTYNLIYALVPSTFNCFIFDKDLIASIQEMLMLEKTMSYEKAIAYLLLPFVIQGACIELDVDESLVFSHLERLSQTYWLRAHQRFTHMYDNQRRPQQLAVAGPSEASSFVSTASFAWP